MGDTLMTTYTPAQIAALAREFGITPETRVCPDCGGAGFWWAEGNGPSYVNSYNGQHKVACETCGGDFDSPGTGEITDDVINPFDHDADPREVDGCWLAPAMWYLVDYGVDIQSLRGPTEKLCSARLFVPARGGLGAYNQRDWGESFALPLIKVAIAARVPEVCAALVVEG